MSRLTHRIAALRESASTLTDCHGKTFSVVDPKALEQILRTLENETDVQLERIGLDTGRLDDLAITDNTRRALLALAASGMPADGIIRLANHYASGRAICLENERPGAPEVQGFFRTYRSEYTG